MTKRWVLLLAVAVLLFSPIVLAQADTSPTAVPTPPVAVLPVVVSPMLYGTLKSILLRGTAIFALIEGLKNVPGFADIFIRYPKLSVIANAVAALLMGFLGCLGSSNTVEAFGFVTCALVAVGTFLAAAGIHLVVAKVQPAQVISGSASPAARLIAEKNNVKTP